MSSMLQSRNVLHWLTFDWRLPTPMYSTQLCIVYRWLQAAKRYFIGLQKNWGPISFT